MTMQTLIDYLRQNVPLTRQIDISAGQQTESWFELCAPLTPNLNDKQTAFGGTLATLCTLSGWCIVSDICRDAGLKVDIAVTESPIRFLRPVTMDPVAAHAYYPEQATRQAFFQALEEHAKARIEIAARIGSGERKSVSFKSEYFVRMLSNEGDQQSA